MNKEKPRPPASGGSTGVLIAAITPPIVKKTGGSVNPAILPIMSSDSSARIAPPTSRYQLTTSYSTAKYSLCLMSLYAMIARPANRWMIPSKNENISICIGLETGLNQIGTTNPGISGGGVPKKVFEMTDTASPKNEPNSSPQIVVDTPHQKNIFIERLSPASIPLNFFSRMPHASAITMP